MKTVKIIIISSCAVGAILFLGASFMLYRGVSDFNAAKGERTKIKRSLEKYYKSPIFPSLENVKQELDNSSQADVWFGKLGSVLYKSNVTSSETSPTKFKTATYNVRRNLNKKARKAGTELPDASTLFAFGFERYAGTDGTLPQSGDVARLIEQLVIINRISSILFDNNIKSISSVKRDIFETSAGNAPEPERQNRRVRPGANRPSNNTQSSASLKNVGVIGSGSLFAKMHFVFEFRAKERALLDILNAFSTSKKMFVVVTSVSLSKNTPVLVPEIVESEDGNDSALDGGSGDEKIAPQRLGPNYPVCGIKMEIPLDIRIELDVYKFKEAGIDSGN